MIAADGSYKLQIGWNKYNDVRERFPLPHGMRDY
jgi:hypothetical protein